MFRGSIHNESEISLVVKAYLIITIHCRHVFTGICKLNFQFSGKRCTLKVSVKYSEMKLSLENKLQKRKGSHKSVATEDN